MNSPNTMKTWQQIHSETAQTSDKFRLSARPRTTFARSKFRKVNFIVAGTSHSRLIFSNTVENFKILIRVLESPCYGHASAGYVA